MPPVALGLAGGAGWEGIVVSSCPAEPQAEGLSVAAMAEAERSDPLDCVCDLLVRTGGHVIVVLHPMAEDDVRNVLALRRDDDRLGRDPPPGQAAPATGRHLRAHARTVLPFGQPVVAGGELTGRVPGRIIGAS